MPSCLHAQFAPPTTVATPLQLRTKNGGVLAIGPAIYAVDSGQYCLNVILVQRFGACVGEEVLHQRRNLGKGAWVTQPSC